MNLKLYYIYKSDNHFVFKIEKKEIFLNYFRDFLHLLDFNKIETSRLLRLMGSSDDNYSMKNYSDELYQDQYFHFKNNNFNVELFFGKDKIMISIFFNSNDINKLDNIYEKLHLVRSD